MNNIKAVIFDLDGTLIDSMGIWAQIDKEYLGNFGYAVPENLQEEITHLTLTETAIYFKNKFNINDDIDKIISNFIVSKFKQYFQHYEIKLIQFTQLNF